MKTVKYLVREYLDFIEECFCQLDIIIGVIFLIMIHILLFFLFFGIAMCLYQYFFYFLFLAILATHPVIWIVGAFVQKLFIKLQDWAAEDDD